MCFRFFLLPPPFLNFFVFSTLLPSWIITFLFHIFQGTYNKKPQFGFMLSLFVILEHFKVLFTSSTELSYWVLLVVPFCSSISVYDWVIWNTKSTYQEIYDKSNFLTPSVSVRVRYPSQHHPLNSHLFILTFLSQYRSIMHTKQGLSDGRWNNTPPLIHLTPSDDVWCALYLFRPLALASCVRLDLLPPAGHLLLCAEDFEIEEHNQDQGDEEGS